MTAQGKRQDSNNIPEQKSQQQQYETKKRKKPFFSNANIIRWDNKPASYCLKATHTHTHIDGNTGDKGRLSERQTKENKQNLTTNN